MLKPSQKPALDWRFSFSSNEKSSYKQPPHPPNLIQKGLPLVLSFFPSPSTWGKCRWEAETETEREEVWGVALCRSFLAGASQGKRARLIIIKTHTTWHVYLMAAPGKDGKLLLSLTVTCWSTTVPCVSATVCVRERRDSVCWHAYVPLTSCMLYMKLPVIRKGSLLLCKCCKGISGRFVFGLSGLKWLFLIILQYLL